jgi:hypothetical protein
MKPEFFDGCQIEKLWIEVAERAPVGFRPRTFREHPSCTFVLIVEEY